MPEDWTGIIAIEGAPTGDGRMIDVGALHWDQGPWPVIWDREDGDHSGIVVGSVNRIWRDENPDGTALIRAEGSWSDSEDPEARADVQRAAELVDEGAVGVSIALDSETVEIRQRLQPVSGWVEPSFSVIGDASLPVADRDRPWSGAAARNRVFDLYTSESGEVDTEGLARAFLWRDPDADPTTRAAYSLGFADVINGSLRMVPRGVAATAGGRGVDALTGVSDADKAAIKTRICGLYSTLQETFEDWADCPFSEDMATIARIAHDDQLAVVTDGRVRHLAIVDTPAFADARIGLVAVALVASAGGSDVFSNPGFGSHGRTDPRLVRQEPERPGEAVAWGAPLTVTDEGHIYGHALLWGRCHAGFRNRCVMPPRDGDYSRFLHGEAEPGIRTGVLTVGTTHARLEASATESMDHYSNTGRAVADVVVGEDQHGLWVSGRLRPNVSERDLADLRGSSLSGDWRPANGKYRLCGLLAVSLPGYLVQRAALVAGGGVITAGPCSCDAEVVEDEDPMAAVVNALAERVSAVEELLALHADATL
jgi:hypothetical protein